MVSSRFPHINHVAFSAPGRLHVIAHPFCHDKSVIHQCVHLCHIEISLSFCPQTWRRMEYFKVMCDPCCISFRFSPMGDIYTPHPPHPRALRIYLQMLHTEERESESSKCCSKYLTHWGALCLHTAFLCWVFRR